MKETYDKDLIGKIALSVYRHHNSSAVTYELGQEAQQYFDKILDNLASQFNSHYNLDEDLTDSQPVLNLQQRADIEVHTKAGELIGWLSCVLWIYRNGKEVFQIVQYCMSQFTDFWTLHVTYFYIDSFSLRCWWQTFPHTSQHRCCLCEKCWIHCK